MKNLLKYLILKNAPLIRMICMLFFHKKYLVGRHFDDSIRGWVWVARAIWFQKILGFNRYIPWPAHHSIKISNINRIHFHVDDLNVFQSPGVYFQCLGADIYIGKGSYIAPNVGIITTNHDKSDLNKHSSGKSVRIGEGCWIGMNAVLLPGVCIGNGSIIGAGAVVTKNVPQNTIAVGNPARLLTKAAKSA